MTKKTYIKFASMIKHNLTRANECKYPRVRDQAVKTVLYMALDIIDILEADNPHFDRQKFGAMCREDIK